jgi:hypothetical protein
MRTTQAAEVKPSSDSDRRKPLGDYEKGGHFWIISPQPPQ